MPDNPWGYKLTFHVYFESATVQLDNAMVERINRAVVDEVPNAHFIGATIVAVDDEPKDQVAT